MENAPNVVEEVTDARDFNWKLIVSVAAIIVAIWVLSFVIIWTFFGKLEVASQFGGMFGAIGALFTGLALAGVVVAITLQRRELELQREELKLTRVELARSAVAQERSEKALLDQATAMVETARLTALQFLPLFNFQVHIDNNFRTVVFIQNVGTTPAFDIDLRALSVYSEKSISVAEFIKRNVTRSDIRLRKFAAHSNGEFAVSDTLGLFSLPAGKNLSGSLIVRDPVQRLLLLFQFRDAYGNNYSQLYTNYREIKDERPTYTLLQLDPITPRICARLDEPLVDMSEFTGEDESAPLFESELVTEDGSKPAEYLDEFIYLWSCALPAGFISVPYTLDDPRWSIYEPDRWRPL